MANKKTTFQMNWLLEPQFAGWLEKIPDLNSAKCNICQKTFSLSNMGRRAVSSHLNSVKHNRLTNAASKNASIKIFTTASSSPKGSNPSQNIGNDGGDPAQTGVLTSQKTSSLEMVAGTQISMPAVDLPAHSSKGNSEPAQRGLKSFLIKDDTTKAEILWCLQTVITHKSLRCAGLDVRLMALMFPDSEIAKGMHLQKDKVGYTLAFGIAPFFKKELINVLTECEFISVGFDESLNKISQKNQMDVNVRYWDKTKKEVKCRYLTSIFLGRSTAEDLLRAYNEAIQPLDKKKIIQISMDGPNVNKKFIRDLKESMADGPDDKGMLDIGSCGLHTVHCAFKGAMAATGWNLISFLRALYNLFKNCPARRALYIATTNSSLFPQKFCAVRWLENINVAERALQMMPHLNTFVREVTKTGDITSNSFKTVSEFMKDPFLPAKLEFFKSLANDLEPFLREFQTDSPLGPFLYDRLNLILKTQISRVVPESLVQEKSLKDIDLSNDLLPAKKVNLGIGVKIAIRNAGKQPDVTILKFRQECRTSILKFAKKMLEKSPIIYKLTKAISCFSPKVVMESKIALKRMELLLTILLDEKFISTLEADRAQREFASLCANQNVIREFQNYEKSNMRLDHFWTKILTDFHISQALPKILRIVMTLSHGNANVERGFSINKECMMENMHEEMLISLRTVYDHVISAGGISEIDITKPLIHAARNSYQLYKENMKKKKLIVEEAAVAKLQKRIAEKELKELEAKRAKILEDALLQTQILDEEITQIKKCSLNKT